MNTNTNDKFKELLKKFRENAQKRKEAQEAFLEKFRKSLQAKEDK